MYSAVSKAKETAVPSRFEIVDPVSGLPENHLARKVFIFSPSESIRVEGYPLEYLTPSFPFSQVCYAERNGNFG